MLWWSMRGRSKSSLSTVSSRTDRAPVDDEDLRVGVLNVVPQCPKKDLAVEQVRPAHLYAFTFSETIRYERTTT